MTQPLDTSQELRSDSMKAQFWLEKRRGFKEIKDNFWTTTTGFQTLDNVHTLSHMPLYLPTGLLTGRNINVKEILISLNDSNVI